MRVRTVAGGLTVNAVAGSCVVALGLNINDADRAGPRGFAIRREDKTEGETIWMKGRRRSRASSRIPPPASSFRACCSRFKPFSGPTTPPSRAIPTPTRWWR